ncbi:MAG: DUF2924 domain-containing protein [Acidobacteriota bacterium]
MTVVNAAEEHMNKAIIIEVESLRRASMAGLRERYREVFQEEARSRHREHLFRKIVWRLQALAEGDLSQRARQRAGEIANDADLRIVAPRDFFNLGGESVQTVPSDQSKKRHDPRLPMVGTLLRRTWNGRAILVEVLEKGFRYENRQFTSLSNIASEITGTRWNGYAFFGLMRNTGKPNA